MSDKLEPLFERYASDLNSCFSNFKDTFICPLCLQSFSRDLNLSDLLSEEHIIPQSIGGRLTTLTCKRCNNQHGTRLEAHLAQRLRIEKGGHPIKSRVFIGEGEFGAEVYLSTKSDQSNKIVGIPKQSHPFLGKMAQEAFEAGTSEIVINLRFGYSPVRSLVALLRSAYLLMFSYFGYRYILQEFTEQIRFQIANPDQETSVLRGVLWSIGDVPVSNVVTILRQPIDFRSFFTILELSSDDRRFAGVILPGFDQAGKSIYERLEELTSDINLKDFFVLPNSLDYVLDPEWVWRNVLP